MELKPKPAHTTPDVGVVPEDWVCRPLASLSAFITKGATPTTYGFRWESDGIRFLRSECVAESGLDLTESMYISEVAHKALSRAEVRDGDVLMTITGNVGRVIRLREGFGVGNINQHIARIRIRDVQTYPQYVYHYLSQPHVRRTYERITTGQAYPQISLVQVRTTDVLLPPLREQRLLAETLSDIDHLIELEAQLLAKKRDIKSAAAQALLSGVQRLPSFSQVWVTTRLGALGRLSRGRGIRRADILPEGLACIRYGEIYTRYETAVDAPISRISRTTASQALRINSGDLLFAGSGETAEEIGKCITYLGDEETYAGGDIVVLSPMSDDSYFLAHLLNSHGIARQKARLGQGDAVVHISPDNLARIELRLPPPPEQRAIASVLSDMDAEIAALEAKRDKMKLIRQGMVQQLLTGRIRLVEPAEAA